MEAKLLNILNNYNPLILTVNKYKNDESVLNNYPIYIINLKKDVIRRNYIKVLFDKLKVNYNMIMVDNISPFLNYTKLNINIFGCLISHLWCINECLKNNYDRFIIFEDDIIFHKNFDFYFKNINMKNIDFLMLGAYDFYINEYIENKEVSNYVYYPKKHIYGGHANVYTKNFAKEFFKYKTENINEFDKDYDKFYEKYNIAICCPNLVVAEMTSTNLSHNYGPFYDFHKVYMSRCMPNNVTYLDYNYMTIHFLKYIRDNFKNIQNEDYKNIINKYCKKIKNDIFIKNTEEILINNGYNIIDIKNMIS